MTEPLDMMNGVRSMDAGGVPRAEIARRLGVSRNTVAKYADMDDMFPAAPAPARRARLALACHERWVESVLEAERASRGGVQAGDAHQALRAARAEDVRRVRLVGGVVGRGAREAGSDLARVPRETRGPRADGGDVGTGKTHMASAL